MEQTTSHLDKLKILAALSHDGLHVTQFIEAPPADVFNLCTRAEFLGQWLGSATLRVGEIALEVRVGSPYQIELQSTAGPKLFCGLFEQIVENNKLLFTLRWDDAESADTLVKIVFAFETGGTRLSLTHVGIESEALASDFESGWQSALSRLAHFAARQR